MVRRRWHNSLVTLGNATLAALAMLATQRLPDHAIYTKVMFVELTQLHKLVNDRFGSAPACRLCHEARVGGHAEEVEIGHESIRDGKDDVGKECFAQCPCSCQSCALWGVKCITWQDRCDVTYANPEQRC